MVTSRRSNSRSFSQKNCEERSEQFVNKAQSQIEEHIEARHSGEAMPASLERPTTLVQDVDKMIKETTHNKHRTGSTESATLASLQGELS